MCGCSKNKPEEATPLTIYEQLKITDKSLSEADTGVIQEGITNWVKSFLAISSDTDSVVIIEDVSPEIKSTKKATYNEKEVAVVDCKTTVRGMRNDQAFEKIYTMQMVVNYQTNVVSVYEVEDITWE